MEWTANGLVIGTRRHGETSLIVELMTHDHGRVRGLLRGGRSRRMAPIVQVGNTVQATWRARLSEHLGHYNLDLVTSRAGLLMENPLALLSMQLLADHLRLLPERDAHPRLMAASEVLLDNLDAGDTVLCALLVRFELALLNELGFGLDLDRCADTGQHDDLVYVSPKTGRAVCASSGAPYHDRLLALPAFVLKTVDDLGMDDLVSGFALSGYFLDRDVWSVRALKPPHARDAILARCGLQA